MRKLYSKPELKTEEFRVEDAITESAGTISKDAGETTLGTSSVDISDMLGADTIAQFIFDHFG